MPHRARAKTLKAPLTVIRVQQGLRIEGVLTLQGGRKAKDDLDWVKGDVPGIDVSDVTAMDTTGAMWLLGVQKRLQAAGSKAAFKGLNETHADLLAKVGKILEAPNEKVKAPAPDGFAVTLGKMGCAAGWQLYEILSLLGEVCLGFAEVAIGRRKFRWNSFVRHVKEAGLMAVPIVALISFLMSIVLAYQGVSQLQLFGAQRFAINLVALSILREMGGLLAAIMVAGRSGSAFTSEIGVMKIREEVDALVVMGMRPLDVMVLPRIAALIVVLPVLTVVAFLAGMLGGGLVSVTSLGVDFTTYLNLFGAAVDARNFWIGVGKAPVFALFIGIISCLAGLRVGGSADSVGRQTTSAVVQGIFAVLVLDAAFSVLFVKMGW